MPLFGDSSTRRQKRQRSSSVFHAQARLFSTPTILSSGRCVAERPAVFLALARIQTPISGLRTCAAHGRIGCRSNFRFRDEFRKVQTQLIGEHLVGSAVAAIAIARTMGVTLDEAVERIAQLPPTERRMSSVVTESGVTFVRDDFKATSDSLEELLYFMECARAVRKIAVIGRISDYPGRSRGVYTSFARSAAKVADLLIFVGERPESLWGGARRGSDGFLSELKVGKAIVHLFESVRDASSFLRGELRHGDFVVLKGSGASDHLERILLEHQTTVRCWRAQCGLIMSCDPCNLLSLSAEPGDSLPEMP